MKIHKITEASEYLGVSINTLKTLANNGKINSFKTTGEHRRFRQDDLDAYMEAENAELRGKALMYDLDQLGINTREAEAVELVELRAEVAALKERLARITSVVDEQAEDDGLWFVAIYITEANLQQALRRLHQEIEEQQE